MRMIAGLVTGLLILAAPAVPIAAETPPAAKGELSPAESKAARLDTLFTQLKAAGSSGEAKPIEATIWTLWLQSGDREIDRLMEHTMQAMNIRAFSLAINYLDAIVAMKPDYAEGWNKRATVHWLMQDYGKSLADIEKTLALEPRHWGALAGLGMIMRDIGEPQKAVAAFRKALEIDPHLDDVKAGLDILEQELGKDI